MHHIDTVCNYIAIVPPTNLFTFLAPKPTEAQESFTEVRYQTIQWSSGHPQ